MDGLIRPLTGIRGYAALWVVFYHVRSGFDQLLPDHEWARSIISAGFLGVDHFALLSGFIISLTYAERLSRLSVKTAGTRPHAAMDRRAGRAGRALIRSRS